MGSSAGGGRGPIGGGTPGRFGAQGLRGAPRQFTNLTPTGRGGPTNVGSAGRGPRDNRARTNLSGVSGQRGPVNLIATGQARGPLSQPLVARGGPVDTRGTRGTRGARQGNRSTPQQRAATAQRRQRRATQRRRLNESRRRASLGIAATVQRAAATGVTIRGTRIRR